MPFAIENHGHIKSYRPQGSLQTSKLVAIVSTGLTTNLSLFCKSQSCVPENKLSTGVFNCACIALSANVVVKENLKLQMTESELVGTIQQLNYYITVVSSDPSPLRFNMICLQPTAHAAFLLKRK